MKKDLLPPTFKALLCLLISGLALSVFAAAPVKKTIGKPQRPALPKPPVQYLDTTLQKPIRNLAKAKKITATKSTIKSKDAAKAPKTGGAKVNHRFLKSGWKSESIAIVSKKGKVEWELKDARETSDSWFLRDGGVIFSHSDGVTRLSADKKVLWTYKVPKGRVTHSCQPINKDGYLIGENGASGSWLVELDAKGKERKRLPISDFGNSKFAHAFRQVRKTAKGTYLGCVMSEDKTFEWDTKGKLIRTFPFGQYVALRLANGNTLISGAGKKMTGLNIVEFDPKGKAVWSLGKADEKKLGFELRMVCGMQVLANGNIVACNMYHGKGSSADAPELFEITRDKKVVWLLDDDRLNRVGSIQILDNKGKALK